MREAIALGHAYIGTEHMLLGLVREDDGAAIRVLNGLGVDPNRVRQQVIQLVSARRVQEEPETGRAAGRGKRKLLSELGSRLDSLEWRYSVLEQRVGTAPELGQLDREISQVRRDKESHLTALRTSRTRPCCATGNSNCSTTKPLASRSGRPPVPEDAVERLRDLLRRHGIDPQDGAA